MLYTLIFYKNNLFLAIMIIRDFKIRINNHMTFVITQTMTTCILKQSYTIITVKELCMSNSFSSMPPKFLMDFKAIKTE